MESDQGNATARHGAFSVEPFDGTVTVRFWDAVVASTDRAMLVRNGERQPAFFIPFRDIYFDFLRQTDRTEHSPLLGEAHYWRVTAMNRSEDDFMWAYEKPAPAAAALARHGTFDPEIARIEAVPAGGGAQRAVQM
jgi:uncharacterized protein (DUF427 family)